MTASRVEKSDIFIRVKLEPRRGKNVTASLYCLVLDARLGVSFISRFSFVSVASANNFKHLKTFLHTNLSQVSVTVLVRHFFAAKFNRTEGQTKDHFLYKFLVLAFVLGGGGLSQRHD